MADDENDLVFKQLNQDNVNDQMDPVEPIKPSDFSNASLFSLTYYKQFFNIESSDVLSRIVSAMNPTDKKFLSNINRPDLFGPIWISFSCSFFSTLFGNIASWSEKGKDWNFNFSSFLMSSMMCFAFAFIIPVAYKSWLSKVTSPGIISLICLYGYSLILIVPVSFLSLFVGPKADWMVSITGGSIAGYSLFSKLSNWFLDPSENKKAFIPNLVSGIVLGFVYFLVQVLAH